MTVDVWADVVCPWCAIGDRRLRAAVDRLAARVPVVVRHRAFELDPGAPRVWPGDHAGRLARRYGTSRDRIVATSRHIESLAAAEGIVMRLDLVRPGNTFDAHRLLRLADEQGCRDRLADRIERAYFAQGEAVGDPGVLARLAADVGLDAGEVCRVLEGDAFAEAVRADERAATEREVTGVPHALVDGRLAIPGAQPVETLVLALERAWARWHQAAPGAATGSDAAAGTVPG